MPSLTKLAYEPETVRPATEIEGILGLKDSSGDLAYLQSVVCSVSTDFPVMVGPEEMLVDAMRAGATGGVCGGANRIPGCFRSCNVRRPWATLIRAEVYRRVSAKSATRCIR